MSRKLGNGALPVLMSISNDTCGVRVVQIIASSKLLVSCLRGTPSKKRFGTSPTFMWSSHQIVR